MNLKEINIMKKFLAISALSLGFLSSAPLALCAPGSANNINNANGANRQPNRVDLGCNNIMIPVFNFSKNDLKNYLFLSKRTGSVIEKLRVNPVGIYLRRDVERFLPNIETFEDHHQLSKNDDYANLINWFVRENNIRTLKYYPGSFDAARFYIILKSNGIIEDLKNITSKTVKINSVSGQKTVHLCGNEWECVIKPLNQMDFRVEYTKKIEAGEEINKKIIFIFSPNVLIDKASRNIFSEYFDLLNYCGLRDFISFNNTLKTFTIPFTNTKIGDGAFFGCTAFERIEIPNSIKSIGKSAFSKCKSLKEIEIPNSVTSIGNLAFRGCTSLEKIKIPNSVKSIEIEVFRGCKSLEKIKIPESVTEIGNNAFASCTSLKEIEIPNSVTSIGSGAFSGCTSLEEIKIPNSVTSIGFGAFSGCTSLKEIKIPNGVKKIEWFTFAECESLKKIEIPNSVTEIDDGAFNGCTSLEEIEWNGNTYGVEEFLEAFKNRLKS